MNYVNLKENTLVVTKEPLAGDTLSNLLRLLVQNRFKIDFRYMPRMLYAITISSIMAPFRIKEHITFEKTIKETEIKHDPIFILGHWRSGTTYLHNVLSLDKNLGYFSTFHAMLPSVFLGSEKRFKPFVASSIPKKRPMDDVSMRADLPQEDEYAISTLSPYSINHSLCFPRNAEFYNRFACMDNISKNVIEEWKEIYLYLLKKETLYRDGKRLVLKNPANTARVTLLLEMFPNARFVHIYRNPYSLYFSMMRFLSSIIPFLCVQKPPEIWEAEKQMMRAYKQIYKKYFKEKRHIPKENLVEIRYEDFIQHPLEKIRGIYTHLHLDGFQESEKTFKKYIASQKSVKTHTYKMDEDLKEKIYKEWRFVFDEFGYDK